LNENPLVFDVIDYKQYDKKFGYKGI